MPFALSTHPGSPAAFPGAPGATFPIGNIWGGSTPFWVSWGLVPDRVHLGSFHPKLGSIFPSGNTPGSRGGGATGSHDELVLVRNVACFSDKPRRGNLPNRLAGPVQSQYAIVMDAQMPGCLRGGDFCQGQHDGRIIRRQRF